MEDSSRYDLPDSPQSIGWTEARHCVVADSDDPFLTDSGAVLPYVEVEYETYGTPAADGSNCIPMRDGSSSAKRYRLSETSLPP